MRTLLDWFPGSDILFELTITTNKRGSCFEAHLST